MRKSSNPVFLYILQPYSFLGKHFGFIGNKYLPVCVQEPTALKPSSLKLKECMIKETAK